MNEDISPELVLVSPDLREQAIAALPPVAVDSFIPPRTMRYRSLAATLLELGSLGLFAGATVIGLVLVLTLVADALR